MLTPLLRCFPVKRSSDLGRQLEDDAKGQGRGLLRRKKIQHVCILEDRPWCV